MSIKLASRPAPSLTTSSKPTSRSAVPARDVPTRPDRPAALAAKAARVGAMADGFEPAKGRSPVSLSDPGQALTDPHASTPTAPANPGAVLGRHSADHQPASAEPDLLGVPEGVTTEAPTPATLPGFSAGPDLLSFKTAHEARAGLSSAEVTSESTDQTDSNGGQHIRESTTTKGDDGSTTTDVQTHDSDGKGNSKETQEVIKTNPNGSQEGHRSERTTSANGTTTTKTEEWKRPAISKMPTPDGEDRTPPTEAEIAADRERIRSRVADPSSENAKPPADLERLARTNAVRQMSKVNPAPGSEPRQAAPEAPRPTPRTPADPVDETPRTNTPPLRPAGGKPGGVPGTPGGPR